MKKLEWAKFGERLPPEVEGIGLSDGMPELERLNWLYAQYDKMFEEELQYRLETGGSINATPLHILNAGLKLTDTEYVFFNGSSPTQQFRVNPITLEVSEMGSVLIDTFNVNGLKVTRLSETQILGMSTRPAVFTRSGLLWNFTSGVGTIDQGDFEMLVTGTGSGLIETKSLAYVPSTQRVYAAVANTESPNPGRLLSTRDGYNWDLLTDDGRGIFSAFHGEPPDGKVIYVSFDAAGSNGLVHEIVADRVIRRYPLQIEGGAQGVGAVHYFRGTYYYARFHDNTIHLHRIEGERWPEPFLSLPVRADSWNPAWPNVIQNTKQMFVAGHFSDIDSRAGTSIRVFHDIDANGDLIHFDTLAPKRLSAEVAEFFRPFFVSDEYFFNFRRSTDIYISKRLI
jgi:hypothetical protein